MKTLNAASPASTGTIPEIGSLHRPKPKAFGNMTLKLCPNALSLVWTEMRSMVFVLGMRVGFEKTTF